MKNPSNISFRRQMELELIEEKFIELKIEITSSLTAMKNFQKSTDDEWKHLETYQRSLIEVKLLEVLNKIL